MSAFVCGNTHINAMLQVAKRSRFGHDTASYFFNGDHHYITRDSLQDIGQKLVDENNRSVNARYSEDVQPTRFEMQRLSCEYSAVEIIKACDCYIYQTCETEDWEATEGIVIARALRELAIDTLPGYDKAAWEIIE